MVQVMGRRRGALPPRAEPCAVRRTPEKEKHHKLLEAVCLGSCVVPDLTFLLFSSSSSKPLCSSIALTVILLGTTH